MERNDIQGLLIRGHGDLTAAAYIMLQITDPEKARKWLRENLDQVTHANQRPSDRLQIVFTHSGLEKLGAAKFVAHGFSVSFQQGMATDYRARILGDMGDSSASEWRWGGTENPTIDLGLLVFSSDDEGLEARLETLCLDNDESGLQRIIVLNSEMNEKGKEHFGFRDGIGQPILAGLSKTGMPENTVPWGEFVLGYENAFGQLPETPVVKLEEDLENQLPLTLDGEGKDFGKNGSYLVFRQLTQDVEGFWKKIRDSIAHENPEAGPVECVQLASKMVGRWPNGTPITLSSERPSEGKEPTDEFLYAEKDALGHGCPLGAHIRRSNPRDSMPDNKPEKSIEIANRHRIIRRGRNFGPPLAPSFEPEDLMVAEHDGKERGLHFLCFNANIARQFEFIQHTWNNNTKFAGQYNDPDPILGIKDSRNKNDTHDFTIQADPLRRKICGLHRHVHVVGGAYFFMPGIRALQFLSQYNPQAQE